MKTTNSMTFVIIPYLQYSTVCSYMSQSYRCLQAQSMQGKDQG